MRYIFQFVATQRWAKVKNDNCITGQCRYRVARKGKCVSRPLIPARDNVSAESVRECCAELCKGWKLVAMVTFRRLFLLSIVLILAGCDTFYGPVVTNGFGRKVYVTVVYSDGAVSHTTWPPCRTAFIGKKGKEVVRVSFESDGKVLQQFSADEIQVVVKKEANAHGYAQWNVGPSGARLDVGTNQSGCLSH